jgi:hypothetical protein
MTKQQQDFVASKEADQPTVTPLGLGVIEVRTEGRESGAYWRRTWRISEGGEVLCPSFDADGQPAQIGG